MCVCVCVCVWCVCVCVCATNLQKGILFNNQKLKKTF